MSGRIDESKAIHPNAQIALDAIAYARQKIPDSASDAGINDLDADSFAALQVRMGAMRKAFEAKRSSPVWLEQDYLVFQHETMIDTVSGVGNCGELVAFAFDYVLQTNPKVNAEIIHIANGNHVVLVIGRNPDSDPNDPATWGDDAYMCDPLEKTVYKATEYQNKLKAYLNPRKYYILEDEKKADEFYILGLGDKAKLGDPKTWSPDAYICDKEGKNIGSAHEFISNLGKKGRRCEIGNQFVIRVPFDPKQHQLVPVLSSKLVLKHHGDVDVLIKNYNLKLRIITKAVSALLGEFLNAMGIDPQEKKKDKKSKEVQKIEKDARSLMATIDTLVADVIPTESSTQTYRSVRKSLHTKLETAIHTAHQLSRLTFFSTGMDQSQQRKVGKARYIFSAEMEKLHRPKKG
ncbi:MAG: hypothetical protein ACYCQI_04810 [Gammaproteobacteria bacterium]